MIKMSFYEICIDISRISRIIFKKFYFRIYVYQLYF